MILAVEKEKNSSLIENQTVTFVMTGCNALSIKLIKLTEEQAIVSS